MAKIGTVVPKLQLRSEGQDAVFQCFSHVTPKWMKGGVELPAVYKNPSILIIRYVITVYTGDYTCVGRYEDGSQFEAKSKLVVGCKYY